MGAPTILGQMNGAGTEMGKTRAEFDNLTNELLEQLAKETLHKTIQNMSGKAQVAVDILIRNLFERTADIGFLATEADIRDFISNSQSADEKASLQARFHEYVAKYSVYHNIILLDCEGKVLVQLDEANPLKQSNDLVVQKAQTTTEDYVEVFHHSDLVPGNNPALIYGYRVSSGDSNNNQTIGVLCLCFRFEDELAGIFDNLVTEEDWSVLIILDKNGAVIASSDPYQIPNGAKLERVLEADYKIVRFAGREYLAKTCPSKGYQGFMGLGWQGHVMVPLEKAFESSKEGDLNQRVESAVLEAVLRDPQLFSEELRNIPLKADQIQEELDLTVWNGNVRQSTRESKVLLWNISAAGGRTKEIFEESIGNLHETVVSSILEDAEFQAALAVDIMDRNLYERANDCRWWALTSDFRRLLSAGDCSKESVQRMTQILRYINDLYTVYTNLFVYDTEGTILAVSNAEEQGLVGTQLHEEWVPQTLGLSNSQAYSVSKFEPTHLYGGKPTYIYGAVITEPNSNRVCGGIGVVFDSAPQFESMLKDSLPQDEFGEPKKGLIGFFLNRKGRILSSSSEDWKPDSYLKLPDAYLRSPNGEGHTGIWELNGKYFAVGSRVSAGYREFKCGDGYHNDVIAVALAPLANVVPHDEKNQRPERSFRYDNENSPNSDDTVEVATFYVGEKTLGFQTKVVCGAVTKEGLTTIPGSHKLLAGKIAYEGKAVPVISLGELTQEPGTEHKLQKIIVIESDRGRIGLLVDGLGEIPRCRRF